MNKVLTSDTARQCVTKYYIDRITSCFHKGKGELAILTTKHGFLANYKTRKAFRHRATKGYSFLWRRLYSAGFIVTCCLRLASQNTCSFAEIIHISISRSRGLSPYRHLDGGKKRDTGNEVDSLRRLRILLWVEEGRGEWGVKSENKSTRKILDTNWIGIALPYVHMTSAVRKAVGNFQLIMLIAK